MKEVKNAYNPKCQTVFLAIALDSLKCHAVIVVRHSLQTT